MADTRPTKVSLSRVFHLCFLAIFIPQKLIEEEKIDSQKRESFSGNCDHEPNAILINRAFWSSLKLIAFWGGIGGLIGLMLQYGFPKPYSSILAWLQIIGGCLLLWGTLFIRGWEIQTYCGITLSEQVNRWIYRALYCVGTALIICSLVWSQNNLFG